MSPSPELAGWPILDAALRGAVAALLAFLALSQLRLPRPHPPLERIGVALALGLCAQVVAHAPGVEWGRPAGWHAPLVGLAMGNAVLFWLFARGLCDDGFQPGPRHAAVWAGVVVAGAANLAWLAPWCWSGQAPGWARSVSQAVFALPLVFGVLGLAAAATRWRDDLVEGRRRLRAFIVVGGSAYTLGMVLARRTTADGRLTPGLALVDAGLLLLLVGATAWMLMRPVRSEVVAPAARGVSGVVAGRADAPGASTTPTAVTPEAGSAASAPPPVDIATAGPLPPADAADERLADALDHAMRVDRAYRDPELSVAGLARRLGVPEYRLRRLINGRLGHRNFSAFLNGHRLAEVRAALADPSRADLPVLTLALEAGFGSIGPFNRAFKAETGLTPSEFRRLQGTDS